MNNMTRSMDKSILGSWGSLVFSDLKPSTKDIFNVPHNQKSVWNLNRNYENQAKAENNMFHADLNEVGITVSLPIFINNAQEK